MSKPRSIKKYSRSKKGVNKIMGEGKEENRWFPFLPKILLRKKKGYKCGVNPIKV